MNFLSLDIRIGELDDSPISEATVTFHIATIALLTPITTEARRVGEISTSPLPHRNQLPGAASRILRDALKRSRIRGGARVDAVLLDFSQTLATVRDPLLIALAEGISQHVHVYRCTRYFLLLPSLPGRQAASIRQFERISTTLGGALQEIVFLGLDGNGIRFAADKPVASFTAPGFASLVQKREGDAEVRLDHKCIRRLGHFRTEYVDGSSGVCRPYSYFLHNAERDLFEALVTSWGQHCADAKAIVFDLPDNQDFRNAIKAFAEQQRLPAVRLEDALGDIQARHELRSAGPTVLILDVVSSGKSLSLYAEILRAQGLQLHPNVIAAIIKGGVKRTKLGEFQIKAFVAREKIEPAPECLQCRLGLPHTFDSHEHLRHIRAFDLLQAASDLGWEREPPKEVPNNVGEAFPLLPNFGAVLQEHGNWFAYKIWLNLRQQILATDLFIIHPEEGDASALCSRLQSMFVQRPTAVAIPRGAIKVAQNSGGRWDGVIRSHETADWVARLRAISQCGEIGALVLDVLNGSGSTCASLLALLQEFRLAPSAYACLVDFDPENVNSPELKVPRVTLYEWYRPRELLAKRA